MRCGHPSCSAPSFELVGHGTSWFPVMTMGLAESAAFAQESLDRFTKMESIDMNFPTFLLLLLMCIK